MPRRGGRPAPRRRGRRIEIRRPADDPRLPARESFSLSAPGGTRTLFLRTPTPGGVLDLRETLGAENTVLLPGILGAVFLREAAALANGTRAEVFPDFLTPELPQCIRLPDSGTMLCAVDDTHTTLNEFLLSPIPEFVSFALHEADLLTARAVEELRAVQAHARRGRNAVPAPTSTTTASTGRRGALLEKLDL